MTDPDNTTTPRRRGARREQVYEFEEDFVDPDAEWELIRIESSVGRRMVYGILTVALAMAIVAGFGVVWSMRQLDPPGPQGRQVAQLVIPTNASLDQVASILEEERVISSSTVFRWYAKIRGIGEWQAGVYDEFRENSTMAEAAGVLKAGPVPPDDISLQIPPGVRLVDALAVIERTFPALTVDTLGRTLTSGTITSKYLPASKNWEGLLAPETYRFPKDASAQLILQTLADQQSDVLDDLGYERAEALAGLNSYELITIASLVEREAGDPEEEKPKIARVINNRLQAPEILGIDAAILYGLGRKNGALTKDDLALDTPYNTRLRQGLPPTPIALPSEASLKAAIEPAEGSWMYYVLVSRDPATHFFTDSAAEFDRAKEKAKADGVF